VLYQKKNYPIAKRQLKVRGHLAHKGVKMGKPGKIN